MLQFLRFNFCYLYTNKRPVQKRLSYSTYNWVQPGVKVSRNAPELRSRAQSNKERAFLGQKYYRKLPESKLTCVAFRKASAVSDCN